MHKATSWHYEALGKLAVDALGRNGFGAVYAPNAPAACEAVLSMIPAGSSIGFGGSVSLEQIGIMSRLKEGEYHLINPPWIASAQDPKAKLSDRRRAMTADVFLTGTNAITLDGRLVNTDATGNRVAGMIFGPTSTIVVAGANKIVHSLDEALDRVSQVAGPRNARRLSYATPCATTGACNDCRSADRICNATVILHRKTKALNLTVVVVGEELGL